VVLLTVPVVGVVYPVAEQLLDLVRVSQLVGDLTEDRGGESFYNKAQGVSMVASRVKEDDDANRRWWRVRGTLPMLRVLVCPRRRLQGRYCGPG
jgi:hypothetical protein